MGVDSNARRTSAAITSCYSSRQPRLRQILMLHKSSQIFGKNTIILFSQSDGCGSWHVVRGKGRRGGGVEEREIFRGRAWTLPNHRDYLRRFNIIIYEARGRPRGNDQVGTDQASKIEERDSFPGGTRSRSGGAAPLRYPCHLSIARARGGRIEHKSEVAGGPPARHASS